MIEYENDNAIGQSSQQLLWTPRIVQIRTRISVLDSAVIPFAILKKDPLPEFQQNQEKHQQQFEDHSNSNAPLKIRDAWNDSFASLRPDQIFFIHAWSTVANAPKKVVDTAGLYFSIATPGPLYKRWLTTKAVERQGELVVWCVEIDMRCDGEMKTREVVLSEENMIQLMVTTKVLVPGEHRRI